MSLANRRPGVLLGAAAALLLAVVLAYVEQWVALAVWLAITLPFLQLALYPWRICRWCDRGRVWNLSQTAFDLCNVCDGRGRRPRWFGIGLSIRNAMSGEEE